MHYAIKPEILKIIRILIRWQNKIRRFLIHFINFRLLCNTMIMFRSHFSLPTASTENTISANCWNIHWTNGFQCVSLKSRLRRMKICQINQKRYASMKNGKQQKLNEEKLRIIYSIWWVHKHIVHCTLHKIFHIYRERNASIQRYKMPSTSEIMLECLVSI